MINVLIVEDSISTAMLLENILNSDPDIKVVKIAQSGNEALEYLKRNKVDVITMDIIMPGLNGFETTCRIMESTPVPIVIISSTHSDKDTETSFKGLDVGAVAVLEKPKGMGNPDFEKHKADIIDTVKLMSEVKVVRRFKPRKHVEFSKAANHQLSDDFRDGVIVIGASTGGPPAIQTILSGMDGEKCPPVIIVQHICEGFIKGMAMWLEKSTEFKVKVPADGEKIKNGHIYLAPDNFHTGFHRKGIIKLSDEQYQSVHKPSINYLFDSVSRVYEKKAIGIILTGMGKDGAEGITQMKNKGAYTIAQDENTSVVFSMNASAIKQGGIDYILPVENIADKICDLISTQTGGVK